MAIKILVLDVDGTMTDGKINMGPQGELFKSFDARDGYAIHEMLPAYGAIASIITGRCSDIVLNRAQELDIKYVLQGEKDKKAALQKLLAELGLQPGQAAYMGDDRIDIEPMRISGVCGCPADAVDEVKKISSYVCVKNGGAGAVREFVEWLAKTGKFEVTQCAN